MASDLLPNNATDAERALDRSLARLGEVPVPVARLWDPWVCPVSALPWLAWAMSVDEWDPAWSEERRRQVVARSIELHRLKGTVWAVRNALADLGYTDAEIEEHSQLLAEWEAAGGAYLDGDTTLDGSTDLSAPDGTFEFFTNHWAEFGVRMNAGDGELGPGIQDRLWRAVDRYKPARSHLVALTFYVHFAGSLAITLGDWSAVVAADYTACHRFTVPSFGVIGYGCEAIGGDYEADYLDGGRLDGLGLLDGQAPTGEPLDGGWGTWSARIRSAGTVHAGGDRVETTTLDPDPKPLIDPLDGEGDLAVPALDGGTLDGFGDLSLEPLVPESASTLDGTSRLGAMPGPEGVWSTGAVTHRLGGYTETEVLQ